MKPLSAAPCKWFALLFALTTINTYAADFHAHKDIAKTATEFLHNHLAQTHSDEFEIRIGAMDRRLRLSQCDTPLEAYLPPGARLYGKTTVGVHCTGSKPWKIFVPATLALYEKVLAVSRTIVRGETLGPKDITLVNKEVGPASQSYFRVPEQAIGFIAKRSIPAGRILTAHMVQAPRLVQAGQEVILLATTPQLEVRMKGKALSDGSKGDIIQVRNVRSKRVIQGIVTHAGVVRVNM
ncbi:flagellar basal body P-ring formation chaperone FlgA [Kaarinaea lacus]